MSLRKVTGVNGTLIQPVDGAQVGVASFQWVWHHFTGCGLILVGVASIFSGCGLIFSGCGLIIILRRVYHVCTHTVEPLFRSPLK